MQLHALDWTIIVAYLVLALAIGLVFKNRAGSSVVEYFASGRSLPWWIAGTSMVATTFAADTPLAVTGLVAKNGIAGNWFWWAFAFGGMLTVFVFAKLWRRAEVLTDVEFIELRYTGTAAKFLRGFRACYVAVIMNSIIIGWVTSAMSTVLRQTVLVDMPAGGHTDLLLIAGMLAITGGYAVVSGMWGVAITDAVQFVLAMVGCVLLAWVAVDHVGGVDALRARLEVAYAGSGDPLAFVPDLTGDDALMPLGVFLVMVLTQWWATWYPGNEPGGGGYVVQRMAACKDEGHAVKATLFFQLAHYCLRPWPWLLVALVAIALHPELRTADNPGVGFPMMIRELAPVGVRGLLLVTFAAAFMSTISTQMNWGASYLVNDVYKRFVRPEADSREVVRASRIASTIVLLLGGGVAWWMVTSNVSVDDAWAFLAALGAGVGTVFLLRWFWWRINVWSEIVAMVGSVVVFSLFQLWVPADAIDGGYRSLLVAGCTLVLWLAATFVTRPEPRFHLLAFYTKVRPDGPGWGPIAAEAPTTRPDGTLGRGILCAVLGTAVIWLTLPGIGALIFGETTNAVLCLGGAVLCAVLMFVVFGRAMRSTTSAA
ncbi:MAG: Na+:solute symporter [Planctomycetes bacterium]|nr:Na+:solute symporter [Planctomycetota bacterium]